MALYPIYKIIEVFVLIWRYLEQTYLQSFIGYKDTVLQPGFYRRSSKVEYLSMQEYNLANLNSFQAMWVTIRT